MRVAAAVADGGFKLFSLSTAGIESDYSPRVKGLNQARAHNH